MTTIQTEEGKTFGFKLLEAGKALIDASTAYMSDDKKSVEHVNAVQINLENNDISFVKKI